MQSYKVQAKNFGVTQERMQATKQRYSAALQLSEQYIALEVLKEVDKVMQYHGRQRLGWIHYGAGDELPMIAKVAGKQKEGQPDAGEVATIKRCSRY